MLRSTRAGAFLSGARGSQPYDPVNKTLVTPHTAGNDDTAY